MTAQDRVLDALSVAAREVIGRPTDEQLMHVLKAGFSAMLTELAGSEAPPPVRELPTEPGSVILATEVRGVEFDHPMLMVRGIDGADWQAVATVDDYQFHLDANIQQWIPARVVRDDEDGPLATLRRVMEVAADMDVPDDEARELVSNDAREALRRLGVVP